MVRGKPCVECVSDCLCRTHCQRHAGDCVRPPPSLRCSGSPAAFTTLVWQWYEQRNRTSLLPSVTFAFLARAWSKCIFLAFASNLAISSVVVTPVARSCVGDRANESWPRYAATSSLVDLDTFSVASGAIARSCHAYPCALLLRQISPLFLFLSVVFCTLARS